MPMNFPSLDSLIHTAECIKFRAPLPAETEADYRLALAEAMQSIDRIEAHEIRTGKGWDLWTEEEKRDLFKYSNKY